MCRLVGVQGQGDGLGLAGVVASGDLDVARRVVVVDDPYESLAPIGIVGRRHQGDVVDDLGRVEVEQPQELLHGREVGGVGTHLEAAAVVVPLDLVQDELGTAVEVGEKVLEALEVGRRVMGVGRAGEHQPGTVVLAPLDMAVDALGLHDGSRDPRREEVLRFGDGSSKAAPGGRGEVGEVVRRAVQQTHGDDGLVRCDDQLPLALALA